MTNDGGHRFGVIDGDIVCTKTDCPSNANTVLDLLRGSLDFSLGDISSKLFAHIAENERARPLRATGRTLPAVLLGTTEIETSHELVAPRHGWPWFGLFAIAAASGTLGGFVAELLLSI